MLSASQERLLAEVLEITNMHEDVSSAISLLQSANWDVESALNAYFGETLGSSANAHNARAHVTLVEDLNQDLTTNQAPQNVAGPSVQSVGEGSTLLLLLRPFRFGFKMIGGLLRLATWIFPFFPKFFGYSLATSTEISIGPKERAREHLAWFNHLFDSALQFFEGSYLDALSQCKAELRYLLVIITSPDHEDMASFGSAVADPKLSDYVVQNDIVVWAGSVRESEGYQLANALDATSFPFITLIAPCPKTPQSNTVVMTSLYKKAGFDNFTPENIARKLDEVTDEHGPKLLALRLERRQQELSREIRSEQDAAYERSLEQDSAREAENAQRRRDIEAAAVEKQLYSTKLVRWKSKKASEFLKEPTGETTRVSLRLASGERVVRKFSSTDTIRTIYEFVLSFGATPEDTDADAFIPRFEFELVCPMPRKLIPLSDNLVSEEPSIWPTGSLIVEEMDDMSE
ncbi:Plant UBX domain-containing protein 10 [Wickerhamiella sorbophila]|uniref:Plant UBX domain-containing protein 10 n=1 Tax=Wickerhamiella sorbophila TaxID=45607 RepID=A0A2T0FI52_9ASCO|nr:Plant UBX domain-containing protein 10 [Wickerhamiella sorbophila]PRT54681.1 Plant UBX domain-containing protein 10 [Wickerhamiella sorbophila]